jgi:prophage regulatory protein
MTRLLTYAEVAARLGVSRSTVERLVTRAEIPQPLHIAPGAVRFVEDEINAWLVSRPRGVNGRASACRPAHVALA